MKLPTYVWILHLLVIAIIALPQYTDVRLSQHPSLLIIPHSNAVINLATCVVMIWGLRLVRAGNIDGHRRAMLGASVLGLLFLISYVLYHYSGSSAIFGDSNMDGILGEQERNKVNFARPLYLVVLASHLLGAVAVTPFVLGALHYGLTGKIVLHKKTVRIAFPLWLYVTISGLVVYSLVFPYYPKPWAP